MAVTDHTRKVLWAQAGNQCARCETTLVDPPEALGDRHAIVGKECHIIARSPAGPRGGAGSRDDIDRYANLVLLCGNCHDVVDTHRAQYDPETLRALKSAHEARVSARSRSKPGPLRLEGQDKPVEVTQFTSGDALMKLIGPSQSITYDDLTTNERSAIGEFTTNCTDFGDPYSALGPTVLFDGAEALQQGIDELNALGFAVLAGHRRLKLSGGHGEPMGWSDIALVIKRMPPEGR